MIGLNKDFSLWCDKCSHGLGFGTEFGEKNHKYLTDIYQCSCGNKFSFIDGIINHFCSDLSFSSYSFISNVERNGDVDIIVGKTSVINLDVKCEFKKIFLTAFPGGIWLKAIKDGLDRFKIISSEVETRYRNGKHQYPKIGDSQSVNWTLYGRTFDSSIETWRELIVNAKEQIIKQNFSFAYFASATALESYYNLQIYKTLEEKNIDTDVIDIFIRESTMPDKLFKLSRSLLGIQHEKKIKESIMSIIQTRNKIAHGKTAAITREEAKECFRIVVGIIFKHMLHNRE